MSYTRPLGNAANFAGKPPYTRPLGNAANFQSVDETQLLILGDAAIAVVAAAELAVDRTTLYGLATVGVTVVGVLEFARVPLTASTTARWAASKVAEVTKTLVGPATARLDDTRAVPWAIGVPAQRAHTTQWVPGRTADRARTAPWVWRGRTLDKPRQAPWGRARVADDQVHAPWGRFDRWPLTAAVVPWGKARPEDLPRLLPWGLPRSLDPRPVRNVFPLVRSADLPQWVPWTRYSRQLQPGWGVVSPPGPTPNPDGTWIVPIQQVYIVLNESTLVRVSDNAVIPTLSLSLTLDADSWTWGWSASVPYSAIGLLERGVELQAAVNGEVVRLVLDSFTRSRSFGKDTLALTGRGRNAPLSIESLTFGNLTSSRTAQQLAYDSLLDNGVPLDWSIAWGLTDWLVPASAWSLQGSRIDAIKALAAAAGGYVQPHNTDPVLRVLHRYPTAPWDWAGVTPDYELPAAVVTQEGIEWVSKPAYNRVFVSGQVGGVLGQITRTGTAGDQVAAMVTDALVTHIDAARQRGLAVLGDTGEQALVTLRLPVLEETGVITPGKFVRYVDGATTRLGLVRSVGVSVGMPEAWQTIKVETHE